MTTEQNLLMEAVVVAIGFAVIGFLIGVYAI